MAGMKKTMKEFKKGGLHSGSKTGPVVKDRKQAIAIGMSEQRQKFSAGGTVQVPSGSGMRGTGAAIKGKKFSGVY